MTRSRLSELPIGPALAVLAIVVTTGLRMRHASVPLSRDTYNSFDFRLSIWDAGRGLLHGYSVYDPADSEYYRAYGLAAPAALYAPGVLLLLAPIIALPLRVAMVMNACLSSLLLWISLWILARPQSRTAWFGFAFAGLALFATQSVDSVFGLGQATGLLVLGASLVVRPPRRWPALGQALGVALLCIKPQTAAPILFVLLLLGQWKLVLRGLALATAASLPVAVVALERAGGLGELVAAVRRNVDVISHLPSNSGTTSLRVDLLGRFEGEGHPLSWLIGLIVLVILTGLAFIAARRNVELRPTVVACWTTLVVYHQFYDVALIVTLALGAALVSRKPSVLLAALGIVLGQIAARSGITLRLSHLLDVSPPSRSLLNTFLLLLILVGTFGLALKNKLDAASRSPSAS